MKDQLYDKTGVTKAFNCGLKPAAILVAKLIV